MKIDLSLWNVAFSVITAVIWALMILARSKQVNEQVLLENADRFERLYKDRDHEALQLRDKAKMLEHDLRLLTQKYDRLMRRVVQAEDYLDVLLEWFRYNRQLPPPRPGEERHGEP